MGWPDFLIIGAPKAGSTALHAALVGHPELFLSTPKEPKFFLTGGTKPARATQQGPGDAHSAQEWIWRSDEYQALFDAAPSGALKGESTPFYLWDRAAHARIAATIPDVKLIAVIRDPVDRAYSNWTHLWSDGLETEPDFGRACDLEEQRAAAGFAPFWRYLGLSRYGEQLASLYDYLPRENVHLLRYRQLIDEPAKTLDGVSDFLGVRTGVATTIPSSNVSSWADDGLLNHGLRRAIRAGAYLGSYVPPQAWRQASRPLVAALHRGSEHRPELGVDVRRALVARFTDDLAQLEELTGNSYADWLGDKGRGTYSVRKS